MHIELSLKNQNNLAEESEEQSSLEDTQTISGSQVACVLGHIAQKNTEQNKQASFQVLAISMVAVFAIVSVYFVYALVL